MTLTLSHTTTLASTYIMLLVLATLGLLATATAAPAPVLEARAFVPPGTSLVSIHPKGHADKCLDAKGGVHNMADVVM